MNLRITLTKHKKEKSMLSRDLFEAAPVNQGQETLRQLQRIVQSGQNADLKIGMEMMPIQNWQATYLLGIYRGIKEKNGVDKALELFGNYDFVDHALSRQETKLSNMSRVSSVPGQRSVESVGETDKKVDPKPHEYTAKDLRKLQRAIQSRMADTPQPTGPKTPEELEALKRMKADQIAFARSRGFKEGSVDEDVKFPYPPRSEKLGRANFELLIRAYNEPTGPRLTLHFGDRIVDMDREDVEALADYYDNELKNADSRMNFIRIVMSDADNLTDLLRKLGRRPNGNQRGLFQETKKKDNEELGAQTKDVALQRAISRAKADFPTAGSGIEALAKDFMRSQEQDQKSFDQLRAAERKQQELLDKITNLDQRQDQEIDDLENANSSLAQRIQQLQSVNSELEKKLAGMTGRKAKPAKALDTVAFEPDGTVAVGMPTAKNAEEPKAADKPKTKQLATRRSRTQKGIPRVRAAQAPAQLTTQYPDILEPIIGRKRPPLSGQADADNGEITDVVPRDPMSSMAQRLSGTQQPTTAKVSKYAPPDRIKKGAANDVTMEPAAQVAETKKKSEADYGADYQDMVKRVGQLAKEGPRKTVWDPVKRVYKTVPVNPPKEKGVAEGYSNDMSTEDMIAYLRQHHDKNLHSDYLKHLTNTNSKFVLKNIPLNSIKTELAGLDRAKVEQYKKMDFSKAPPIVVGSDGNILDGYHRANVAKALNIPTIKAYVGIKGQQGVAEGEHKKLPWRVQGAGGGYSHRYYVVRGYGKTGKGWDEMWKGKHGTGDFVSKERAEQKAAELNQVAHYADKIQKKPDLAEDRLTEGIPASDLVFYVKNPDGTKTYARVKDEQHYGELMRKYQGSDIKVFDINRPDVEQWLRARRVSASSFWPGAEITIGNTREEDES